jgi:hypothetical protein
MDIIAYERVWVGLDDDIETIAKEVLSEAMEDAGYGAAGDRNNYGNRKGRDMLDECHELRMRVERLEGKAAKQSIQVGIQKPRERPKNLDS